MCAIVVSAGVGACASATPSAEAPSAEDTAVEGDDVAEGGGADAEAAPSDDVAEAGGGGDVAAASGPVDVQTFQNALQAVLGDPSLLTAMGLDPETAGPILISGKDLPDGLERAAAVRSVEVVPESDKPGKRTILHFTSIELSAERGTFKYRCDATGATGTTRVAYDGEAWQLTSSRVSKH